MKNRLLLFATFFLALSVMVSCSKDEEQEQNQQQGTGQEQPGSPLDLPFGAAYVMDSSYLSSSNMTVYNFAYPSVDPSGRPIMLSGTITMDDEVSRETPANGMVLYNHFTIYRADQCPTRGELSMQALAKGLGLITVSADYYGFGVTEHHHQAYCMSLYNARTCIDALLAARQLLAQMGFSWDDVLFNVGYSQGGQTSMAVVRLAAEQYPDLDITYTLAGAGSYDLPATYRKFLDATISGMPSTVVSVMLAYNEFGRMGLQMDDMFIEPVLSNIDDWFYSKKYTREEIDELVGSLSIADYVTPAMLDVNSPEGSALMTALDGDNLCHGWTPRGDEHIMLFHSSKDITVPVVNTQNMYDFLVSKGVQNVDLQIHDIGSSATLPAHENAALMFGLKVILRVKEVLGMA